MQKITFHSEYRYQWCCFFVITFYFLNPQLYPIKGIFISQRKTDDIAFTIRQPLVLLAIKTNLEILWSGCLSILGFLTYPKIQLAPLFHLLQNYHTKQFLLNELQPSQTISYRMVSNSPGPRWEQMLMLKNVLQSSERIKLSLISRLIHTDFPTRRSPMNT